MRACGLPLGTVPDRSERDRAAGEQAADLKAPVGSPIVASNLDRPYAGLPPELGRKVAHERASKTLGAPSLSLHLKVVGAFEVPAGQSSYWFGQNIAARCSTVAAADQESHGVGAAADPDEPPAALPGERHHRPAAELEPRHRRRRARRAAALTQLHARALVGSTVLTGIPALLHADAVDRSQLNRLVVLAEIQLLLLVGLVLIAVLAATMEQRRPEVAMATLRGSRPSATAVSVALEPVTLLLLGLVPGLLLAVPLARLGARLWLRPGTPVHLTGESVVAALAVTAAAAVAVLIVGGLAASRPLPDQLAAAPGSGRGRGWLEIIAVTLGARG